ncbi:alpha/beta hydrolase [Aeromicrobium sp. NPDC092404]|uniref:alpha/beta hydrolase n=1 Tax=Aeromicrobium sp. NPDC092404 TaxID=3154976 RepID=UPI00342351B4
MATVVIPAPPPAVPPLDADPKASSVSSALRRAGSTTSSVADWAHDSGAPADWSGDAAEAASHARTSFAAELDVVVAVVAHVAAACERYEAAISGLDSQRETLIDERAALADRQNDFARRAASYEEDEEAALVSEANTLQGDIDAYVGRVESWQTSLTRAEDTLIAAFQSVDSPAEADQFAAAQSQGVQAVMDRLVDSGTLPEEVRGMDATQLREYLVDHPDVARTLMEQSPMPGATGPEGLLAGLVQPAFTTPGGAGELHEQRRDDARALFEGLSPADASLLATLFPSTVGGLSGVPFEYRADANAVGVVVALDDERANLDDLQDRHDHNQEDGDLFGLNNDDLEGDIGDAEDRIALYESILDNDRQIILFDPSGDGAIAELHGDIGADTQNVGVSVPGTTTDMSSFQGVANKSDAFVADSDGDLAMISWMGGDLPDDIVQDAPFANYAHDLGPSLADFSHDVRQEINHSAAAPNDAQTTYLGHSYGGAVVGRAELSGLDADRVLHVESAGMGHDIQSPDDLPDSQDGVDRYSMTAPGDIIGDIQGTQVGDNIGHGADPDEFEGTIRLDTGNKADGTPNIGVESHSDVFLRQSDAYFNMLEVLNGGTVTTYREPEYEDPPLYPHPGWTPEQTGWKTPGDRIDIE